ncbi:MAG: DUF3817 domain-containing protein [Cyclobacteriaceae bacterium]|nr:DUF3817 domain-containing protein [Cyclobacteriaceae bacterium]MCH8515545.1 DUF3817 domain-containing protein [Cyclobacteriaceae bacterium]
MKPQTLLKILRIVAYVEGTTYLLLFVTMPLKYMADMPAPNYWVGMTHGVFFIFYLLLVLMVAIPYKWSKMEIFYAGLASIIPVGTFVADHKIFKKYENQVPGQEAKI